MERRIVETYTASDNFFLTAMGGVFERDQLEAVAWLMSDNEIENIYVVNDTACSFIANACATGSIDRTDENAGKVLATLLQSHATQLEGLSVREKSEKLAQLNGQRQAEVLFEDPMLVDRIKSGEIKLKGLLFDRSKVAFTEYEIQLEQVIVG
ncbi:hypothetical protein N6H18_13765 [Reichenbachiella agarivorans]|uniref:Uncharacterized protein n=1 Tax=Reichenbachiella agarivorans TaxID=2979464 RepID=A0ABY6CPN1_9BACT|nr:carbonic anhydrase [Reichenbachiella agarivorans]UXP31418.1 hypothetical protein N6H18_13765 [Reichenbachiella agarivorans]